MWQASDAKLGMVNIRAEDSASPEELLGAMTKAEQDEIVMMKRNARLYEDLAKSLAPGVFGHEDVKRAVLLMLLGGVHKETAEVHSFFPASTQTPCCSERAGLTHMWLGIPVEEHVAERISERAF